MKTHRTLALALIALCAALAGLLHPAGKAAAQTRHWGATTFYGDVALGSWPAPTSFTAAVTSGGVYTNGAVTALYRIAATNAAGRSPWATNGVAFAGGDSTNSVALAWARHDGARGYRLERSPDGVTWTQGMGLAATAVAYTDVAPSNWTAGAISISEIAAPAVPWVTNQVATADGNQKWDSPGTIPVVTDEASDARYFVSTQNASGAPLQQLTPAEASALMGIDSGGTHVVPTSSVARALATGATGDAGSLTNAARGATMIPVYGAAAGYYTIDGIDFGGWVLASNTAYAALRAINSMNSASGSVNRITMDWVCHQADTNRVFYDTFGGTQKPLTNAPHLVSASGAWLWIRHRFLFTNTASRTYNMSAFNSTSTWHVYLSGLFAEEVK
jgi:hypothetical protein